MKFNDFSGRGRRPFPVDQQRKSRVMVELAKRGMSITDLADEVGIDRGNLSKIICGRDLSESNEARIAAFLRMPVEYLFPPRSASEIAAMREAEARKKRGAA